jgi:hypothetical protein
MKSISAYGFKVVRRSNISNLAILLRAGGFEMCLSTLHYFGSDFRVRLSAWFGVFRLYLNESFRCLRVPLDDLFWIPNCLWDYTGDLLWNQVKRLMKEVCSAQSFAPSPLEVHPSQSFHPNSISDQEHRFRPEDQLFRGKVVSQWRQFNWLPLMYWTIASSYRSQQETQNSATTEAHHSGCNSLN